MIEWLLIFIITSVVIVGIAHMIEGMVTDYSWLWKITYLIFGIALLSFGIIIIYEIVKNVFKTVA